MHFTPWRTVRGRLVLAALLVELVMLLVILLLLVLVLMEKLE